MSEERVESRQGKRFHPCQWKTNVPTEIGYPSAWLVLRFVQRVTVRHNGYSLSDLEARYDCWMRTYDMSHARVLELARLKVQGNAIRCCRKKLGASTRQLVATWAMKSTIISLQFISCGLDYAQEAKNIYSITIQFPVVIP